jgi:hypothetical protein
MQHEWKSPINPVLEAKDAKVKESKLPGPVLLVRGQSPRTSRDTSPEHVRTASSGSCDDITDESVAANTRSKKPQILEPSISRSIKSQTKADEDRLRKQLQQYFFENQALQQQIESLASENVNLHEQQHLISDLKSQIDDFGHENLLLRQQLKTISEQTYSKEVQDHIFDLTQQLAAAHQTIKVKAEFSTAHQDQYPQHDNAMATASGILDSVLAPKVFTGDGDEDASEWIEFFENYVKFRKLTYDDTKILFPLFLRGSARDWWRAMTDDTRPTDMVGLVTAFRNKFKPTSATKWRSRSELWQRHQRPDEKVGPYIEQMKAIAKRLALDDETTMWSIMNGLRDEIRPAVIEHNPKNLSELKAQAELSESARCSAVPFDIADAFKQLESRIDNKIDKITTSVSSVNFADRELETNQDRRDRRIPRWEEEHERTRSSSRSRPNDNGRWRGRLQRPQNAYYRQTGESCRNCGRRHPPRQCYAYGLNCHHCGLRGHIRKMCRKLDRTSSVTRQNFGRSPRTSPVRSQ